MQNQNDERIAVARQELASGKGTKTDIGKLEIHLACTSSFNVMLNRGSLLLDGFINMIHVIRRDFAAAQGMIDSLKDAIVHIAYQDDPVAAFRDEIRTMMYGKYKYSAYNWKKVRPPIRYIDACGRHILHIIEEGPFAVDAESGLLSASHALCDLSFFTDLTIEMGIDPMEGYDEWVERERLYREQ